MSDHHSKLLKIQSELEAPKNQWNDFSKFKYRSCEDILMALKPLLAKYNCTVFLSDSVECVGERYYVKATCVFIDLDSGADVIVTAFAREEENKKGMDGSQITGGSSSYARKYALNGMFLIDDEKDADFRDNKKPESSEPEKPWYNDFDKHKNHMITRINNGEAALQILGSIKDSYKVSREVEQKILALGK